MVKPRTSSAIRDLLELTEQPHVISLAGGLPNPATFPVGRLSAAATEVLAADPSAALQYGPTEGARPLRELLAARAARPVEDVLVTAGSQQALDLVARTLVAPGDPVVLADPAYIGALQAFRGADAELHAVASDRDGLDVEALADLLHHGLRPALVYVVANFDNPTGSTLSGPRRHVLAELADRFGFWIIDDDPYGELRWAGERLPSLAGLTDRAITLGSASKVLCPGLRVGWLVAPAALARQAAIVKQGADLHTSSLSQAVVHRLLADGPAMAAHLESLRTTYRAQATALHAALEHELGPQVAVARANGGMFLWAEVRTRDGRPIDADALLRVAIDHGTAFVPGSAFAVSGARPGQLRASFATGAPDELAEAARRLGAAVAACGKMADDRGKGASPWTSPSSPSRTTSGRWAPSTPT